MNETQDNSHQWGESDSATFLDMAKVYVPAREEQTTTLLQLIPARVDEEFTIVELAAGEGMLAKAILKRFPRCHYIALDGSAKMREHMAQTLSAFQDRVEIVPFELAEQDWRDNLPQPLRCVVSSLCVHHLYAEGKRQLFAAIAKHLAPGGALLLADLIEPANQQIANLYARQYDEIVYAQSMATYGDLSAYEQFQQVCWNYFAYDYGVIDTGDYPSPLSDQLQWLHEAGFKIADCFWLRAGHAIYGGYV